MNAPSVAEASEILTRAPHPSIHAPVKVTDRLREIYDIVNITDEWEVGQRATLEQKGVEMWLPMTYCLVYAAINVFLWALPVAQLGLFLITAPLGVLYFLGVAWLYGRLQSP